MAKLKKCDLSGKYKILIQKHIQYDQWVEIDTKDIIIAQQNIKKLPVDENQWKKVFEDYSISEIKKLSKTKKKELT